MTIKTNNQKQSEKQQKKKNLSAALRNNLTRRKQVDKDPKNLAKVDSNQN